MAATDSTEHEPVHISHLPMVEQLRARIATEFPNAHQPAATQEPEPVTLDYPPETTGREMTAITAAIEAANPIVMEAEPFPAAAANGFAPTPEQRAAVRYWGMPDGQVITATADQGMWGGIEITEEEYHLVLDHAANELEAYLNEIRNALIEESRQRDAAIAALTATAAKKTGK